LFLRLATEVFGVRKPEVVALSEQDWESTLSEIKLHHATLERWDRKFFSIDALAEFFLVRNLLSGRDVWPQDTWRDFLLARARQSPEELTVHVSRFGRVDFLRLSSS
jgi:hypothetical protein